jgi:NAD(P)-dependent dehydrogenase (short-subunit alcohol dehydrogenase family)
VTRAALVTGAGGAIGGAIARALAADGYRVGLCDSDPVVNEVCAELASSNAAARAAARVFDVADRPAAERALAELADELGAQFDTLVGAAAIVDNIAPSPEFPPEVWERELAVNLSGAFWCARALSGGMRDRGFGRIVMISSGAATAGQPNQIAYGTSKAGLLGMVRTLAAELASAGVTCNAVLPGLIATPRVLEWNEPEDSIRGRIPVGRMGSTEEVAALVRFLCSDDAAYVTGACIPIDGGLWLNGVYS